MNLDFTRYLKYPVGLAGMIPWQGLQEDLHSYRKTAEVEY